VSWMTRPFRVASVVILVGVLAGCSTASPALQSRASEGLGPTPSISARPMPSGNEAPDPALRNAIHLYGAWAREERHRVGMLASRIVVRQLFQHPWNAQIAGPPDTCFYGYACISTNGGHSVEFDVSPTSDASSWAVTQVYFEECERDRFVLSCERWKTLGPGREDVLIRQFPLS
jgi:hypothetical protein